MKAADVDRTKKARTSRTVCAEAPCGNPEYFVGIDLHEEFMQGGADGPGRMGMRTDGTDKRTAFLTFAFVCGST